MGAGRGGAGAAPYGSHAGPRIGGTPGRRLARERPDRLRGRDAGRSGVRLRVGGRLPELRGAGTARGLAGRLRRCCGRRAPAPNHGVRVDSSVQQPALVPGVPPVRGRNGGSRGARASLVHAEARRGVLMRIATWNVNSLKARLEKVQWWLERARPDVLMMQETKLRDADAPVAAFRAAGYELAHHGEGRWNGVAILSRVGIESIVTNFGEPVRAART